MNGYPGLVEPFVCKTFWLSHIAYWISTLFYNTLLKRPLTSRNRYEESFHLILLSASLFACKSVVPMIVCVVVPHSVLAFTKTGPDLRAGTRRQRHCLFPQCHIQLYERVRGPLDPGSQLCHVLLRRGVAYPPEDGRRPIGVMEWRISFRESAIGAVPGGESARPG